MKIFTNKKFTQVNNVNKNKKSDNSYRFFELKIGNYLKNGFELLIHFKALPCWP